jgi:transcriptional regulator with XRE-family HTH domain
MDKNQEVLRKFGERISLLRRERNLSIQDLAAASGLEAANIEEIEAGKVNFLLTSFHSLAVGLAIDPEKLLESI